MNEPAYEQYEKTGYLTENYRIFHIRDYAKDEIPFHYHDFYKIIFFVEGKVDYLVEGKTYPLKPHDFVLVGANVIHKPSIDETSLYERYIIYLSEEFLARKSADGACLRQCFALAQQTQNRVVHFAPESYEELLAGLLKIERLDKGKASDFGGFLLEAAVLEFMARFNKTLASQPKAFITTAVYQEKVVDVIAYIQEHLTEEINADMLSETFYISKYYLMRQFKLATGYPLHQYVNEKRILLAKRMILAGMPPSKACFECGFRDYSTFARRFREIVGASPSKLKLGLSD